MDIHQLFSKAIKYIINILILYIILVLIVGLLKTIFYSTSFLWGGLNQFNLSIIVIDILTFLVMIELFKSFIDYFKAKRFRLHSMLDPAIIIIARELIVKLYSHKTIESDVLIGFGVLIFSIGVIRTLAVCYSPDDVTE